MAASLQAATASDASPARVVRAVPRGVVRGAYPERETPKSSKLDELVEGLAAPLLRAAQVRRAVPADFLASVAAHREPLAACTEEELVERRESLRGWLLERGFEDALVARAFALAREWADRRLGTPHYDTQLLCGHALLRGTIAEMQTGEGKTLSATLAACTAALSGLPVHVITVNDYLAQRDAESLLPLYDAFGLSVGVIVSGMDPGARRSAYACDVTYCTNKEVAFDYLKDRIALQGHPSRVRLRLERVARGAGRADALIHRGLVFGIVDEADSILVDEARTPLIISGANQDSGKEDFFTTALGLARLLDEGTDFEIEGAERLIHITEAGSRKLEEASQNLPGLWQGRRRREEWVRQGLSALHVYVRDQHYLLVEDKVQIIDEYTGRVMADRSWEHGLHQMIEMKEGVPLTGQQDTLARISYQRFFSKYLRLAGMTGTAQEVRRELWSMYRLAVVPIPTHRPCRREDLGGRVFVREADKWQAVLERIEALHAQGRPLLIGTRSLGASERLSELLQERDIPHRLLNARQDREEAEIVARAGELGRVTVATNMAGRGTDIVLGPGVEALGGLHVLGTERHDSARIDRQLAGRAARQGDSGSVEYIVSLEDELMRLHGGRLVERIAELAGDRASKAARRLRAWAPRLAQARAGRLHRRMRRDLQKLDSRMESLLAFSGRSD